jgi:hypothetical protein
MIPDMACRLRRVQADGVNLEPFDRHDLSTGNQIELRRPSIAVTHSETLGLFGKMKRHLGEIERREVVRRRPRTLLLLYPSSEVTKGLEVVQTRTLREQEQQRSTELGSTSQTDLKVAFKRDTWIDMGVPIGVNVDHGTIHIHLW